MSEISNNPVQKPVDPQLMAKILFFVELVNMKTITKASERCGVSKSTGSRWLCELQDELGIALYQGSRVDNKITDAGIFLYEQFSQVNEDVNQILNQLTHYATDTIGKVSICCAPIPLYSERLVLTLINDFTKLNPNVDVQLVVTPRAIEQSHLHDFIMSSSTSRTPSCEEPHHLDVTNLMEETFVTVASPEYIRQHGEPLVPSELATHRCLYSGSFFDSGEWIYRDGNKTIPVSIDKKLQISDSVMVVAAATSSMGIGYLPKFIVDPLIKVGALVPLLTEYETDRWYLNLYYHSGDRTSQCVQKFSQFFINNHRDLAQQLLMTTKPVLMSLPSTLA